MKFLLLNLCNHRCLFLPQRQASFICDYGFKCRTRIHPRISPQWHWFNREDDREHPCNITVDTTPYRIVVKRRKRAWGPLPFFWCKAINNRYVMRRNVSLQSLVNYHKHILRHAPDAEQDDLLRTWLESTPGMTPQQAGQFYHGLMEKEIAAWKHIDKLDSLFAVLELAGFIVLGIIYMIVRARQKPDHWLTPVCLTFLIVKYGLGRWFYDRVEANRSFIPLIERLYRYLHTTSSAGSQVHPTLPG